MNSIINETRRKFQEPKAQEKSAAPATWLINVLIAVGGIATIGILDAPGVLGVLLISLALSFPFAVICALAAPSRGRVPRQWFAIGLITGAFGLIALLVMGKAET